MIKDSIYNFLKNDSGVSSLVGTRIYPTFLPQDVTLPAITYTRISATNDLIAHRVERFQITAFAKTNKECEMIKEALNSCLNRFKGDLEGLPMKFVSLVGIYEMFEPDTKIHSIMSDYKFNYITSE